MTLLSVFSKLSIGLIFGGTIGGVAYLGINNSSKKLNEKDQIQRNIQDEELLTANSSDIERIEKESLRTKTFMNEDKEEQIPLVSSLSIREVLAEYVLVNENLEGCERLLESGENDDSIIGCNNSWSKNMKKELKGKDGWIIRGKNNSVNEVIKKWGQLERGLGVDKLNNPWVKNEGDNNYSLIEPNSCIKSNNSGIYELKVVCSK